MRHPALKASAVAASWAIAMLIPGANVVALIVVMLPLWVLHDAGLPGLGAPNNGFFVPTTTGYALGALIIWLAFFLLFLVGSRRTQGRDVVNGESKGN